MEELSLNISGAELNQRELERVTDLARETGRKAISIFQGGNSLNLHIKTHNTDGTRTKYSIKAKLITPIKSYNAEDFDWELLLATSKTLKNLERIFINDHKKHIDKRQKKI